MNTEPTQPATPQPEPQQPQSAVELLWETDIEVIGICKFPCVRSKYGGGVILTGSPALEVKQLAALHNKAIESLRAQLATSQAEAERLREALEEILSDYHKVYVNIDNVYACNARAALAQTKEAQP